MPVITIATNATNRDYIDFTIDGEVVSALKRITTTGLDPDNGDVVNVHFNVHDFPPHAPVPLVNQQFLTYLNGGKKTLILSIDWNDVTSPVVTSGDDLRYNIDVLRDVTRAIIITLADFSGLYGNDYVDSRLIGKIAGKEFLVFSNDGTGGLQKEGDGYTFDNSTGTITVPDTPGNYVIVLL